MIALRRYNIPDTSKMGSTLTKPLIKERLHFFLYRILSFCLFLSRIKMSMDGMMLSIKNKIDNSMIFLLLW